eukprot:scaffold10204_cov68-Phaeocystis_antarctica.AAC.3
MPLAKHQRAPTHQPPYNPSAPGTQYALVRPYAFIEDRAVQAQLVTQESASRACRPRRAHIARRDPQPLASRIRAHMFCTYAHNDRPYPRGGLGCARPNPGSDCSSRLLAYCDNPRAHSADAVFFRPGTVIAIAPVWISSPSRFSLSRMSLIAASITKSLAAGLKNTEIALGTASLRLLPSCPTPLPCAMSSVRSVATSPGGSSSDSESSSGLTLAKS